MSAADQGLGTNNAAVKQSNAELPFKPEFIMTHHRQMTKEQFEITFKYPELTKTLLAIITRLTDSQLQQVVPFMSIDQIKNTVPKLQLQQNGALVQAMSPAQVRHAISALPSDDQRLLMQNISLLTASSGKEELQSFISFIDPLAMCIAIKLPELTDRLVEASGVMTTEQIKVIVPLLSDKQIRDLLIVLEHDSQLEVAILMIDRKEELIQLLRDEYPAWLKSKEDIVPRASLVKDQLINLEHDISRFSTTLNKESEYNSIVRMIKNIKAEIETLQKMNREIASVVKLPARLCANSQTTSHLELHQDYLLLNKSVKEISKELHTSFSKLDVLISSVNKQWEQIKATLEDPPAASMKRTGSFPDAQSDDYVFVDDEQALLLYEAIREIGNPDAIGNFYTMTWKDIINAGFRSSKDFKDRSIQNLEQLQSYVNQHANNTR